MVQVTLLAAEQVRQPERPQANSQNAKAKKLSPKKKGFPFLPTRNALRARLCVYQTLWPSLKDFLSGKQHGSASPRLPSSCVRPPTPRRVR